MHIFYFILFLLGGVLLALALFVGLYTLMTLKRSDRRVFDAAVGGFIVVFGGYLFAHWLVVFMLVAPIYISML